MMIHQPTGFTRRSLPGLHWAQAQSQRWSTRKKLAKANVQLGAFAADPDAVSRGANPDLIPASLGMLHSAGHMLRQVQPQRS